MNETPPLPQPSGTTCPNCGAAQSASAPFCTNCGAPLQAATSSGLSTTAKVVSSLALGCGALMFGAVGGCFVLLGVGEGFDAVFALFVLIPALLALACLWGIFKVQRK